MRRAIATAVAAALTAFLWMPAEAGTALDAPDAAACLAHPTVTCSVDLALAASAGGYDDYERAQLVLRTGERMKDLTARKVYFDQVAARFFAGTSTGQNLLDQERRVTDIAVATIAGDNATADRRLGEVKANFGTWWETLTDVMDTLADAGRPDLADATETKFHRVVNVSLSDGMGRNVRHQVWDTRAPLARALVRCACGRDPLPMILTLHRQEVRLKLAPILYSHRQDVEGLTSFLTQEFGSLAKVKDKRQRMWVGYSFGTMLLELPLRDIPAALRKGPAWMTADHFERPAEDGMASRANIYGDVLARAVTAGDRAAVAALVKLQSREDIVWLSGYELSGSAKADDLLPKLERDHARLLRVRFVLAHGDVRKGLAEAMQSPSLARVWHKPHTDIEEGHDFEYYVLEPLLARGAFDGADEAASRLRDPDFRKATKKRISTARAEAASPAPKDAGSKLAALWKTYQEAKTDPKAHPHPGSTFLFAVRDLIAAQPDAFPFE